MIRLLCWAVFLVFLCAITPVIAKPDTPPKELVAHIQQYPVVHQGSCNFRQEKNVNCLIFYDKERETVYLVFFNEAATLVTKIVVVKDKQEKVLWCGNTTCV